MAEVTVVRKRQIYKIVCLETGEGYIGLALDAHKRRREHERDSSCRPLRAAFEKYGPERFSFEILCECDDLDGARKRERELIAEHGTGQPHGFNVVGGASGLIKRRVSPEERERLAALAASFWARPGHRKAVSAAAKEFWNRPENLKVLADRMRKRWEDPAYRERMSGAHWSRKHSPETREKLRVKANERHAAKKAAGGSYAALVDGSTRAWHDPEKKQKRLASIQGYWESEEGQKQKEVNRLVTAQRNREMWKDPEKAAKFLSGSVGKIRTPEARKKMSDSAKRRRARERGDTS